MLGCYEMDNNACFFQNIIVKEDWKKMKPAPLVIDIQKEFFNDDVGTIQSLKKCRGIYQCCHCAFQGKEPAGDQHPAYR
jgi:hypothetical protein